VQEALSSHTRRLRFKVPVSRSLALTLFLLSYCQIAASQNFAPRRGRPIVFRFRFRVEAVLVVGLHKRHERGFARPGERVGGEEERKREEGREEERERGREGEREREEREEREGREEVRW